MIHLVKFPPIYQSHNILACVQGIPIIARPLDFENNEVTASDT